MRQLSVPDTKSTDASITLTQWQEGWGGPRTATQLKFDCLSTEYHSKALLAKENCAAIAKLQKAIWSHVVEHSMELEIDITIAKASTHITWDKPLRRTEKAIYSSGFPNLIFP